MVEDKKEVSEKKTVTGLPVNTEHALCYVLGWVSGLVFFLLAKEDKKLKFHALQSVVVFGALHIFSIILGFFMIFTFFRGFGLFSIFYTAGFVLWLILIIKAYNGDKFEIPIISEWVRGQLK